MDDSAETVSAFASLAREIRSLREAADLSQEQLARVVGYTRQYVSLAERVGKGVPSKGLIDALDTALHANGRLRGLRVDAIKEQRTKRAAVQATSPTAASPDVAEEVVSPDGGDIYRVENPIPRVGRSTRPMSASNVELVVEHLREQWHLLVKTDNLLGPRQALRGVLGQLAGIEELLGTIDCAGREQLVRIAAQYAESASWLHEDSGNAVAATYWSGRALEWAIEGQDQPLTAWTLFRRSQQAMPTENSAHVLSLIAAARRAAPELPTAMRAAFAQQEAQAFALSGEEQAADQKLDEAITLAVVDPIGEARGGHGSFCTSGYLEMQRARCSQMLGKFDQAIATYLACIPALPEVYRRDRGSALSRLAGAYVAVGEPEAAAQYGRDALQIGRETGSVRIIEEVRLVGRKVQEHRGLSQVAQLLDDLHAGDAR